MSTPLRTTVVLMMIAALFVVGVPIATAAPYPARAVAAGRSSSAMPSSATSSQPSVPGTPASSTRAPSTPAPSTGRHVTGLSVLVLLLLVGGVFLLGRRARDFSGGSGSGGGRFGRNGRR